MGTYGIVLTGLLAAVLHLPICGYMKSYTPVNKNTNATVIITKYDTNMLNWMAHLQTYSTFLTGTSSIITQLT